MKRRTTAVFNAAPDGYTLLAAAFNHIVMNHAVKGVHFDPQTDFEVIGRTARAPLLRRSPSRACRVTTSSHVALLKKAGFEAQ